jgi:predicted RecB family nuclease
MLKKIFEQNVKIEKGLGLSLSKIKMFNNCNYRYYLQYFKKEKIDKKDYNPKFFKIGQFAHKWIESKIKGVECTFNSTTLTDEDKTKTVSNCENVFKNEYIKSLIEMGGVAEEGFSMNISPKEIDGLVAYPKYSRKADFSGIIDFYVIDGKTAHIVDWKTGSIKDDSDESFMQLMLYAKALQKLKNVNKIKMSFFYTDHNKLVTRDITIDELNLKIQKIVENGINIPTKDEEILFPPNVGEVCKYCPYSVKRKSDGIVACKYIK